MDTHNVHCDRGREENRAGVGADTVVRMALEGLNVPQGLCTDSSLCQNALPSHSSRSAPSPQSPRVCSNAISSGRFSLSFSGKWPPTHPSLFPRPAAFVFIAFIPTYHFILKSVYVPSCHCCVRVGIWSDLFVMDVLLAPATGPGTSRYAVGVE